MNTKVVSPVSFLLISFCFLIININSQITSTTAGGRWENTSTWTGGVVPSSGSDVVINGPVIVSTGSGISCNNLTVNSSGTLYNGVGYAWPDQVLIVNGNLINNGTLRNEGSRGLILKVKGNLTNNGTWSLKQIELTGSSQTITSAPGKKFGSSFVVDATAKPTLSAGSDLIFTSSVDLGKSTLDMKNFAMSFYGSSATITNGTINNTANISGFPLTNSSYDRPQFYSITFSGNPNIKGRIQINTGVTFKGNLTVTDTVESISDYYANERKFYVEGNIVNNGIIKSGGRNPIAINISGNATNNATWTPNRTELSGKTDQTLSLMTNKVFDSQFSVTDSTGLIKAGSKLSFSSTFNLNKTVLDMNTYALELRSGSANISNGIVMNTRDLIGTSVSTYSPILSNILYDGIINLKGLLRIDWGVTMRGTVTLTDTLQNSTGYAHPEKVLKIIGNFVNNGLSRDGGSSGFVLDITGNITANKAISNKRIQLAGNGNRTISDKLTTSTYYSTGEKVVLVGTNYLPNLSIATTSKCQLAYEAKIYVLNNSLDENLDNWSEISVTRSFKSTTSNNFFKSAASIISGAKIDSIKIQSFGHQLPSSFGGAVKCWWRLTAYPGTTKQTIASLTLKYNDDLLGSNDESKLQVYHSDDNGVTWKQLSTSTNITRNTTTNAVTLIDANGYGDYLLSSSADPNSVVPSIVVSIVGRSQIRVGPPNRYTINYLNNSDSPVDDFLMAFNTGKNIHILKLEQVLTTGQTETLPADSLFYNKEDTTLVLYVSALAPREERSFDVILTADNVGLSKSTNMIEPLSITVTTVLVYTAKAAAVYVAAKAIDYVFDKGTQYIKKTQDLKPEELKEWEERHTKVIDENKQESRKMWALKKIGSKILSKLPNVPNPGTIVKKFGQSLWELAPTLRRRFYYTFQNRKVEIADEIMEEGGKVYKPEATGNNAKTTQRVTSWDPNEKIGPTGFGDKKYITTAGKMNYQILFENKKEATAPAWKITIVDTLGSYFDPETFVFGKTSHDGPQYNWVMTRTGNIVKWEIEGIELPPNVNAPEGEGYVLFSVNTKPNLPSGTEIKNAATIVFDINKPIRTNVYSNTLDYTAPTTKMLSLTPVSNGSKLIVKWSATDNNGSGIETVSLYGSKDNGPYEFVGSTAADSLIINMDTYTHDYSYYALAKDNVGNNEVIKPAVVSLKVVNDVDDNDNSLPKEYSLSQNYPNPFNPNTTIEFALPYKGIVNLRIYNLLGQEITTLVNEELMPGKYKRTWNAGIYASGVYFYRLQAGSFTQTKKLLLLK